MLSVIKKDVDPLSISPDFDSDVIHLFLACDDDKILGAGGICSPVYNYKLMWLGPSLVYPEFRGQGLQRKLIQARIDFAKQSGYKGLETTVYHYNKYSRNNVEAMGFKKKQSFVDRDYYVLELEK